MTRCLHIIAQEHTSEGCALIETHRFAVFECFNVFVMKNVCIERCFNAVLSINSQTRRNGVTQIAVFGGLGFRVLGFSINLQIVFPKRLGRHMEFLVGSLRIQEITYSTFAESDQPTFSTEGLFGNLNPMIGTQTSKLILSIPEDYLRDMGTHVILNHS